MSNTSLAYYKVKAPASILNSRYRLRAGDRQLFNPAIFAASGLSLRSITLSLLISALILLLSGLAQAQRPAAASHIVKPGESLGTIALAYGVSLHDLQSENNIWSWLIYAGQELAIPAGGVPPTIPDSPPTQPPAPEPAEADPTSANIESSGISHTVLFGESLSKIALAYGVSLTDLRTLNNSWSPVIHAGQELAIPAGGVPPTIPDSPPTQPPAPVPAEANPTSANFESSGVSHIVRFGESLSRIALAYGVSLTDLRTLNNAQTSIIHVGQKLEIPAGGTPPEFQDLPSEPQPAQPPAEPPSTVQSARSAQNPSTHTVQRGETLFRIARRYDISVNSLMSINGIQDPARIHAGNLLRLSQTTASAPPASNVSASPVAAAAPATAHAVAPAPAPAAAPAPVNPGNRERYIVRRGDFLTQLGIDLHTSWIALAKLNNLPDPNNLHVGSTLLIPERADVELYDPEYAAWKYFDMIAHQPGPRIGVGREIVIVLGTQSAYAYENGILQKAARVSAGKKATPTIQGDHEIWLKRRSQTMSGPGYSLDNVEWVMYFYRDYAIHGAWWHMNFGQPMSKGCVNLTNTDAQWFYNFASLGTPVYVRA